MESAGNVGDHYGGDVVDDDYHLAVFIEKRQMASRFSKFR